MQVHMKPRGSEYQCDVRSHGRFQLELKVHYPVPGLPRIAYDLDVFFFAPAQLGLNQQEYGIEGFLADVKTFTRFTTPAMQIRELASMRSDRSPLARIHSIVMDHEPGRNIDTERIVYELRTLGAAYRVELRRTREDLLAAINSGVEAARIEARVETLLSDIESFLSRVRELRHAIADVGMPVEICSSMEWVDEWVSLKTEVDLYRLHDGCTTREDLAQAGGQVRGVLGRETAYRRDQGYSTIVDPQDPVANEGVISRDGALKKWVQSALYLTREESKASKGAAQLVAAIAAATAMAFAVVATFFAERLFASYSVPWALLVVVGYIFKDRIKEILRGLVTTLLPRIAADQTTVLIDPNTGKRIGLTRSAVRFRSPQGIPEDVRSLRNSQAGFFGAGTPREDVMHFHKRTRFNGLRLHRNHTRVAAVTNIVRIRLGRWLREMDDPVESLRYMEGDMPMSVDADRVYEIGMIVGLAPHPSSDGPARQLQHRLVLNRDGLLRIEKSPRKETS